LVGDLAVAVPVPVAVAIAIGVALGAVRYVREGRGRAHHAHHHGQRTAQHEQTACDPSSSLHHAPPRLAVGSVSRWLLPDAVTSLVRGSVPPHISRRYMQ